MAPVCVSAARRQQRQDDIPPRGSGQCLGGDLAWEALAPTAALPFCLCPMPRDPWLLAPSRWRPAPEAPGPSPPAFLPGLSLGAFPRRPAALPGRCLVAARPASLVSSGKALGGSRGEGGAVGARLTRVLPLHWPPWGSGCCSYCCCSGPGDPRAPRWTLEGSTSVWAAAPLSSSAAQAGGRRITNAPSPSARGRMPAGKARYA